MKLNSLLKRNNAAYLTIFIKTLKDFLWQTPVIGWLFMPCFSFSMGTTENV